MLQVKDITLAYDDEVVLDKINFSIGKGKCMVILGPSGCGKTTLLHLMAGLKHPSQGAIEYRGKNVVEPIQEMIFQGYGLFPWKTVRENLILPYKIRKERVNEKELAEVVEELGLKKHLGKYPSQLSGGQRQRVAFARALAPNPQLLLLDEPFAAIDAKVRQELRSWLKEMIEKLGVTSIFVTHDQDEAIEVADEIIITNHGKIEQKG